MDPDKTFIILAAYSLKGNGATLQALYCYIWRLAPAKGISFLVAPCLAAVLLQAGFPVAVLVVADVCVEPVTPVVALFFGPVAA